MYLWFLVVLVLPLVAARGPYNNLGDIFQHQLANLPDHPPYTRSPQHGGLNAGYCCLKAVNESLEIRDGYLQFRPGQTHLRGTADEFLRYQFPCDARYNGSLGGPSQVFLSYSWCHQNCPGWMVSGVNNDTLTDWGRLLVVFIVPAVIFSLTISRRRRLILPSGLFPRSISTVFAAFTLIFVVPLASLFAIIDLIVWMGMIVTMAGPMIVSGLFEATLDFRMLKFLRKRIEKNSMTVKERAHLLLLILIGNLDLYPAWEHSQRLVASLPHENLRTRCSIRINSESTRDTSQSTRGNSQSTGGNSQSTGGNSQSTAVEPDISPCLVPQPSTTPQATETAPQLPSQSSQEFDLKQPYPQIIQVRIQCIGLQLRSLLEAQPSFGSTTGAAVVFYTVSFIFSLIELSGDLGISEIAHSIAYAIFWMVIPHVSIVSSLLLASNNPSPWAAMTAGDQRINSLSVSSSNMARESTSDTGHDFNWKRLWSLHTVGDYISRMKQLLFPYLYETPYAPAWLWDRGAYKYSWIRRYQEEYPNLEIIQREVLSADLGTLVNILASALFLLVIPAFFAGMVSYTTPTTGLSCKSMTHLLYATAQTLMAILWLCRLVFRGHGVTSVKPGFPRINKYLRLYLKVMWHFLFTLSLIAAFFASIIGSMFMLMGYYNNCLCWLPIWYWRSRFTSPEAEFYVGGNSFERNYNAKHYWIPVGASATALLVAMSYVGWWYQKHHRRQFIHFAECLDHINEEDMRENGERVGFDPVNFTGIEAGPLS